MNAELQALKNDVKRFIGRKFDDTYVQKLKNSDDYRFKIVKGDEGQTEVEVRYDGLIVRKSPEEICSEILKNMKESASEYLGTPVTEAVISVPAYFSNAQRKATKAAAELSGLTVLKLITEPVAAAIHYAQDRLNTNSTLLVFDFGGGTLDVSIIKVDGSMFAVKSIEGDSFFGGRDFDQMLLNSFKSAIQERLSVNVFDGRLLRRIQRMCEDLKKSLSFRAAHSIELYCLGEDANSLKLTMNRQQFDTLIGDSVERALGIMTKCLKGAGLTKENITDVLLVGGSTRIPKIREKLTSLFGVNKIRTNLNPDQAVALGAGIQAAIFKKEFKKLEKYEITEITPLSLGLRLEDDLMAILIDKNSSIPKRSNPNICYTVENNQKVASFNIYEGERKNIKYNNLLGSFTIDNLPSGKAGDIKFEVVFHLDEDGILEVSARETSTGKHNKLIVTLGEFRLCDHEIRQCIENAEQNKKDDELFDKYQNKIQVPNALIFKSLQ
ncbi:hypothetical protein YQE_09628, partial [Dendroctonus ponderosae]